MLNVAIWGAAGNMGTRAVRRLSGNTAYNVMLVEPVAGGEDKLRARGDKPTAPAEAAGIADVVILAIADKWIRETAAGLVPQLKPGAILMMLDPAAAYADVLPKREDVTYFVTHPTHPNVFNDEVGDARQDYFGAGLARQSIVSALVQGPDSHYAIGEAISRAYFGPIVNSHRVTLEQLAILEPAMAETCGATFIVALREAMEAAIEKGVPRPAAVDFMLGHINVQLAIVFEQTQWRMSEGAYLVIKDAMKRIFREDWKGVFDLAEVKASTRRICDNT